MERVSADIKDAVNRSGRARRLLSATELLDREKLQNKYEGGQLDEDQVVVAAIQPIELGYEPALQVKKNIDDGIRYVYFFHGSMDGAQKICRLLQMILVPMLDTKKRIEYRYLQSEVEQNQNQIVQDLKQICARESLKIFFLPAAPNLQYCIHNATSVYKAVLYFKRGDKFMQWEKVAQGRMALS